jgi:hypothetical protein
MADEIDTSKGWCCGGRTWVEHVHADGECCQPEGKQIADLPPEGGPKGRSRTACQHGLTSRASQQGASHLALFRSEVCRCLQEAPCTCGFEWGANQPSRPAGWTHGLGTQAAVE